MPNYKATSLFLWVSVSSSQIIFDDDKFNILVTKMESTVRELAREVERLYEARCDEATITSCAAANYANCLSQFPNVQCPTGPNFENRYCGDAGVGCSSQNDFTVSSTRIPANLANGDNYNPTDPRLIEALCFTRPLDDWFVKKRNEDLLFWLDLGIDSPPSMYFGSNTGAFRVFPAGHTENCDYDPRIRPWYVAASSGPKNVIMILDVSGSIDEGRMFLLKLAAKRVVETLTVQDRITIIPFATNATTIADPFGRMFKATAENIDYLAKEIDELVSGGRTNFYDAFDAAFDVFNATIDEELYVSCNSAILFFTDGERTHGPDNDEVTQFIQDRIALIQPKISNKPILLFAYSISQDEVVHVFPSQLACAVDQGVWSRISSDDEIIDSLSNYYNLFALGLGSDANENFVAWVEPYQFFEGRLGTTVSAPVYDRTSKPHILLGVVAVDIPIAAIDVALGADNSDSTVFRNESIRRIVLSSRVSCPLLNLTECELESYRGVRSACSLNCTADELVKVEEEECPGRPDYPTDYWANFEVVDSAAPNRICCSANEVSSSDICEWNITPPTNNPTQQDDDDNDDGGTGLDLGDMIGIVGSVLSVIGIGFTIYEIYYGTLFREVRIFVYLRQQVGRPPIPSRHAMLVQDKQNPPAPVNQNQPPPDNESPPPPDDKENKPAPSPDEENPSALLNKDPPAPDNRSPVAGADNLNQSSDSPNTQANDGSAPQDQNPPPANGQTQQNSEMRKRPRVRPAE